MARVTRTVHPRLWCVGGVDSELRIPFLQRIRDLGIAVTALTSGPTAPFTSADIPCISYRLNRFINPFADFTTVASLAELGRRAPPDLVQTFDTKPGIYLPLALRRTRSVPVVRTINGLGALFSPGLSLAACCRPVYAGLQRVVAPLIAMNVFQNAADQETFVTRGFAPSARVRLIPSSGIDIEAFAARLPSSIRRAAMRHELGLNGKTVVVTVSRLTRQKGIGTLLDAARELWSRRKDVVFLLVGPRGQEGPFAIKLEELERHAPYVRWLGERDDVPDLLGASDVFVLPTAYREGVPRVLLEAGVARLPVVTTNMPGCSDVVEETRSGVLIPSGDARRLAAAIEHLVDDAALRVRFGVALQERVAHRFHIDAIVQAYLAVYNEVLAKRRRGPACVTATP